MSQPRIVIIGGGAGGLELATKLGHKLGKKNKADITLFDVNTTHIWKPLLHEVAAGTLNSYEDEINYASHAHSNHFSFQLGKLINLDKQHKTITLAAITDSDGNEIIPQRKYRYDIAVIAVGSRCNDFNITGVKEHCLYLDSRQQAETFHQQLLNSLLKTVMRKSQGKDEILSVAIVGGGATGVELAAELRTMAQQAVSFGFDKINPTTDIHIHIIEAAPSLLSNLSKRVIDATTEQLTAMGIQLHLKERVSRITKDAIECASGLKINATLKIWAAGIKAPNFLTQLQGLETNQLNQLVVTASLQTTNDDSIFAFGDCAQHTPMNEEKPLPPRAQTAHQQANYLAKFITAKITQYNLPSFRYSDKGSLISLGSNSTVGQLMSKLGSRFYIEGFLARLTYQSLYKMHQINLHGYYRVILLTIAKFLTRKIKPRLKLH